MKCPTCNVNLMMTDRNGVEIDYCPDCRGVWLDRGELDKIIERTLQAESGHKTQQPQRPHDPYYDKRHDDDKHYDYKRKKKDSFLGDLFDF
ncbi:MAG: zf-TFIIB domain-containing protein [Saprospiraceae bacterium]|nr:zf-TFIIB domain-containing protein [Saprospiraceae bacterium]